MDTYGYIWMLWSLLVMLIGGELMIWTIQII